MSHKWSKLYETEKENGLNERAGKRISIKAWLRMGKKGQSFVELAILFPLLIMLLSGVVEFGFLLNQYLDLLDGAREAARFASDGDPFNRVGITCVAPSHALPPVTNDFYQQTAYLAVQTIEQETPNPLNPIQHLFQLRLNPNTDDVVISAYGISSGTIADRYPHPPADLPCGGETNGEWHLWGSGGACSGDSCNPSGLSNADIASRLSGAAPNTGAVSVEIMYDYHQVLGLPWLTAFVPNPIHVRVFAIMPLVSAEPTSP